MERLHSESPLFAHSGPLWPTLRPLFVHSSPTLAVERRASVATATMHPPAFLRLQDSKGSFGWVLRCACRALHSRPTSTSPRHRKSNTRPSFISLQVHFAFPEPAEVPPPLRGYINKPLAEARSFVSVVLQVHFAFPEPTELPPPLIQLNDVSFKYPGRDDFGLEDLNIGIVRPLHPLHCSSIPLNVACHNLLRCPACPAPLGQSRAPFGCHCSSTSDGRGCRGDCGCCDASVDGDADSDGEL